MVRWGGVVKISLTAQIAEIDRELLQRREVYPRLVATRKLRESHAKFQTDRMEAVRATLQWLHENEMLIRQRLG
jgi:hypothetical protein